MININVMSVNKGNDKSLGTEHKILEAAKREFVSKGFSGARTASIAEAAGVTHAMLHYYFRTKEKLFDRILTDVIGLLKNAIFTPVEDISLPFDEMIKRIIERHLDFLADNPDLPRFIISEIYSNPDKVSSVISKIRDYAPIFLTALQEKIDRAADNAICRRVDVRMLMLDIVSLNIFSFMAKPVIEASLENLTENMSVFIEQRKKENYDTIMRKLKP